MYTRQQASIIRDEFWTAFGQYMAPVPSMEGLKVNWLNYKTGEKDIRFRMEADTKRASIGIVLVHKDPVVRMLYFEQLHELKNILREYTQEEWTWNREISDDSLGTISSVHQVLSGVNIFDRDQWPAIIRFLKPRIIALDAFWYTVKDSFSGLR